MRLGAPDEAGEPIASAERVVPGRLSARLFFGALSWATIVACGLAIVFAWTSAEWSLVFTSMTALVYWGWQRLYRIGWSFRRRALQSIAWFYGVAMSAAAAALCWERAAPQPVIGSGAAWRSGQSGLYVAAALFALIGAALIAHAFYLGRGWRRRRR